jgi:hypothetical protein
VSADLPNILAHDCREAVRAYVIHHGLKRGLHLFASRASVSERRARGLYAGEVRRVWAEEWHGATAAHAQLRCERAAALRVELLQIEECLNAQPHLARAGTLVGAAR